MYVTEVVKHNYLGYNILRIGPKEFLALGQSEGEYLPEKLAAGGYKKAFVAPTLAGVKAEAAAESVIDLLEFFLSGPRAVLAAMRKLRYRRRQAGDQRFPATLVEADFFGFNILRIGPDEFLALDQSEGEFFPSKLAGGGYKRAYVGASLEAVKNQVTTRLAQTPGSPSS